MNSNKMLCFSYEIGSIDVWIVAASKPEAEEQVKNHFIQNNISLDVPYKLEQVYVFY